MDCLEDNLVSWSKNMPKLELHAHLSGSISDETIRNLLEREEFSDIKESSIALLNQRRTLENCFAIFPVIHSLIKDSSTLEYVVHEVLNEFQDDNVVYLELRTTPRNSKSLSSLEYIDTILRSISEFHKNNDNGLVCRLLMSIDRSKSVENAWSSVQIAKHFLNLPADDPRSNTIVGFELSGNPTRGRFDDFIPVLDYVRKTLGLPVSLHFAEVDNESEALQMLEYRPERLGHAAVLSENILHAMNRSKIPVEICLSSNLLSRTVPKVQHHPAFKDLLHSNYPVSICTDDAGLFQTNSSSELSMYAANANINEEEAREIIKSSIKHIFCRDASVIDRLEEILAL